ncbi:hypothetical protein KP509_09G009200 [Ceratopteris richardii]|uniref:Uncharacterized protein n=1 Tax=Ceratopteris richardii TaxID=49495 RepID=A0A8T2TYU7_CERRI|nr:hypothetical protein KP509_09G009200 [Ceratopteris richardii]
MERIFECMVFTTLTARTGPGPQLRIERTIEERRSRGFIPRHLVARQPRSANRSRQQQKDEAVAAQGGNATNGHFDVPEEGDDNDINADDLNILNSDPAEDLENKPPASQTIQKQWRVATRASPLRELSIGSNGELHIKRNHLGTFPVHSSSPGSNNYYIRVSPSSPSMKSKSSFCPPLHTEGLKSPCSARTWYLNDPTVNPNFIKDIADQQLCKETRSLDDDDTLKVVGRSYYFGMQDMNPVEAENQEEIFKSDTDQENMDGFIEDLQVNNKNRKLLILVG